MKKKTPKHLITHYVDSAGDGAQVFLDGKCIMSGQEHDFHPGCENVTEFGEFQGSGGLVDRIELTLLRLGHVVAVSRPLCHFDYNGRMVLGEHPDKIPKAVAKKLHVSFRLRAALVRLDDALGNADKIIISMEEDVVLHELGCEAVVTAWEDFATGIDWFKYAEFQRALKAHTDF